MAFHITQRGTDGRETFSSTQDYLTYLALLARNLGDAEVRVLGYCLMTNHIHLVAIPEREDSLAVLLRRVHGRYAQYYNARSSRSGHLWQNRFFACALQYKHLWQALTYVERNPVRAGMVRQAAAYSWSSALAHVSKADRLGILDMEWWRAEAPPDWEESIDAPGADAAILRRCTYAGRPFGDDAFVSEVSRRFGRSWVRGRPAKSQPQAEKLSAEKSHRSG